MKWTKAEEYKVLRQETVHDVLMAFNVIGRGLNPDENLVKAIALLLEKGVSILNEDMSKYEISRPYGGIIEFKDIEH